MSFIFVATKAVSKAVTEPDSFFIKFLLAFLGTATALLIFVLNSYRDKYKENRRKKTEWEDKIQYLFALVDGTIRLSSQQVEFITTFISNIEQDNFNVPLMTFSPLTDFVRATTTLGKEDYFLAFNKKFERKEQPMKIYNKLLSNIDYLHAYFIEIPKIAERAVKSDEDKKGKLKLMVDEAITNTGQFLNSDDGRDSIFNDMETILTSFLTNLINNSDSSYYINNFIIPLHQFTLEYINLHHSKSIKEVLRLAELCRNARQLFNFIGKENLLLAVGLKSDIDLIQESIDELSEQKQTLLN